MFKCHSVICEIYSVLFMLSLEANIPGGHLSDQVGLNFV